MEATPTEAPRRPLRWIFAALAAVAVTVVLLVVLWPHKKSPPEAPSKFDVDFAGVKALAPSPGNLHRAIDSLAKPENRPALRKAVVAERDTFALLAVVEALRKLNDREAAPALIERLKAMKSNRDAYPAGVNIALLLGDWQVAGAADAMVDLPEFYFPHGAEPPLVKLGPDAVKKLAEATAGKEDPRRLVAEDLLAQVRDPKSKDLLLAAAKAGRRGAIQALGSFPSEDVEIALAAIADSPDLLLADAATGSLVKINPSRHRLRALSLLQSADPPRILFGCALVVQHGVPGAEASLRKLLGHPDQDVQFEALRTLASVEGDVVTTTRNEDGTWTVESDGVATLRISHPAVIAELERREEMGK